MIESKVSNKFIGVLITLMLILGGWCIVGMTSFSQRSEKEPVKALESNGFVYTVSGSEATIIQYTGTATTLSIPATIGSSYTVVAIGDPEANATSFIADAAITSVTIPTSVVTIHPYTFYNCASLATVTFSSYLSSNLTTIGSYAFKGCGFREFIIPPKVNSIGTSAFAYCEKFHTVQISSTTRIQNSDATGPELINWGHNHCWARCTVLSTIKLYDGFTSGSGTKYTRYSVNAGSSGNNRLLLTNDGTKLIMSLPGRKLKADSSGNLLNSSGTALTSSQDPVPVNLSGTANTRSYVYAVIVPSTVTTVEECCFIQCRYMKYCKFAGTNVTTFEWNAFAVCINLESDDSTTDIFTIPYTVTSFGHLAFYNCFSLTRVRLPNDITARGYGMFGGCSISEFLVSTNTGNNLKIASDGVITNKAGTTLVIVPTYYETLNTSFDGTYSIPYTITTVGPYAFEFDSFITTISIPSNSRLTKTAFPNVVFRGCTNLEAFELVAAHTNLKVVDGVLFWADSSSVTVMAYPRGKEGEAYTIPTQVESKNVTEIGVGAFAYSDNLKNVTLPSTLTTLSSSCFYSSGLERVVIPSGVTMVDTDAFDGCESLKSAEFLMTVRPVSNSAFVINTGAFTNCNSEFRVLLQNRDVFDYFYNRYAYAANYTNRYTNGAGKACFVCLNKLIQITLHDELNNANLDIYSYGDEGERLIYSNEFYSEEDVMENVAVPYSENFVFTGYYSAPTDGTQYINANGEFVNNLANTFNVDTTLYARWKCDLPALWSSRGGGVRIESTDPVGQYVRFTVTDTYSDYDFYRWSESSGSLSAYVSGNTLRAPLDKLSDKVVIAYFKAAGGSSPINTWPGINNIWRLSTTYGGSAYAQEAANSTSIKFQATPMVDDYIFTGWKVFDGYTLTTPANATLPYITLTYSTLTGKTIIPQFEYAPDLAVNKKIEMQPALMPAGTTFAGYIPNTVTRVIFDWYSNNDGTSFLINGVEKLTGLTATNISQNFYPINYYINGTDMYVLTKPGTYIYANPNCYRMFYLKTNLAEIQFNNFNTSLTTNMSDMFYSCGVTSLDLSKFDTKNVTTMECMFYDVDNLTSVDVSSFNTSNVTNMRGMFQAAKFTDLDLSNFDVSKVTTFRGMFYLDHSLTNLNITGWTTPALTSARAMFDGCYSLKDIDLSGWNTALVTDMYEMFTNCRELTSLNLSNFRTTKVTDMEKMFYGCGSLLSLNIANFSAEVCTTMRAMFSGCVSLRTLTITNMTTAAVTTMRAMFYNCQSLTSLNLSKFTTSNVTDFSAMFSECKGLTSLTLTGWVTTAATTMEAMFYNCRSLTSLNISMFTTTNVVEMTQMFQNCVNLATLTFTKSKFTTANVTDMDFMFCHCEKLATIDVSGFNTAKVTTMEQMFAVCPLITTLNVSSWNSAALTKFNQTFAGCNKLKTLSFNTTNWTIANVTTLYRTFANCYALNPLNVSTWNTAKVTNMEETFANCLTLSDLYVSGWNTAKVTTMAGTFLNCVSLINLDVSSWNTALVTNMSQMFKGLSRINQLDLGSFNTTKVTDMSGMFYGDKHLRTIYVNATNWKVTKVKSSAGMFYNTIYLRNYDAEYINHQKANTTSTGYLTAYQTPVTLITGADFAAQLTTSHTSVTFDWYTSGTTAYSPSGTNLISGVTGVNVDANGNGDIKLYVVGTNVYVLTAATKRIVANASCLNMFNGKTKLATITFNNFDTSNVTTMEAMFSGCSKLASVDTSGFITSNVTTFKQMFKSCPLLTKIDGRSFDTRNVKYFHETFYGCTALKEIQGLANWDTTSLTSTGMYRTFYNCQALTGLDLSRWNFTNVTSLYGTFYHCYNLTYVDLNGFENAKVTTMNATFTTCSELISIDLSKFNSSKVTTTQNAFNGCAKLRQIKIGTNWTNGDTMTTSTGMFTGCTLLPNFSSSVVDKTNAHANAGGYMTMDRNPANLKRSLNIPSGMSSVTFDWYTNDAGTQYSPSGTNLISGKTATNISETSGYPINLYVVDKAVYVLTLKTTQIMANPNSSKLFAQKSSLTTLNLYNFNTSNVVDMSYMFYRCSHLTSLDVSMFDTSNVTDMSYMFDQCGSSSSFTLDISHFDTSNVTDMSYMFNRCFATTLDVSHFDTSNVTNMSFMFYDARYVTTLDLSNFDTSNVTDMTNMFFGCQALQTLNVSSFDTKNVIYMYGMFSSLRNITVLDLGSFDTKNVESMSFMFSGSTNLATIKVGAKWNVGELASTSRMFSNCTHLPNYNANTIDGSVAYVGTGGYLTAA